MQDIPDHLNAHEDFEYVREHCPPEKWLPRWKELLDSRYIWRDEGKLASGKKGVEDADHRVEERQDDEKVIRMQQVRVEDPNARLFRLDFTVKYVKDAIAAGEAAIIKEAQ